MLSSDGLKGVSSAVAPSASAAAAAASGMGGDAPASALSPMASSISSAVENSLAMEMALTMQYRWIASCPAMDRLMAGWNSDVIGLTGESS